MPGDRRQILSLLRLPIPPLQLADDSSSQAALRTRSLVSHLERRAPFPGGTRRAKVRPDATSQDATTAFP